MSKKYEELNEAKKKRFEGRKIEKIQVDVKYENYHVNEIMDLILPDETPRYAIKANTLTKRNRLLKMIVFKSKSLLLIGMKTTACTMQHGTHCTKIFYFNQIRISN